MITHIEGKLIEKTPTYAVIDCHGVGYLLHISLNTFSQLGNDEKCKLFTHLSIKEDAHTLFGFAEEGERILFRHLISVSGIGPSTARMILSSMSPIEVKQAITSGNVNAIRAVKGIGEKGAQRIIIDLKDKLYKEDIQPQFFISPNNRIKEEALSALVMLGFARNMADKALEKVMKQNAANDLTVEQLIKQALINM
jgi:holliday junction DNA helicase RuvA